MTDDWKSSSLSCSHIAQHISSLLCLACTEEHSARDVTAALAVLTTAKQCVGTGLQLM